MRNFSTVGRRGRCPANPFREELMQLFEAARWASSSYNGQPWRFLYAEPHGADWQKFLGLLIEFNQKWCAAAAALVVVVSRTTFEMNGKPSATHAYDCGSAWGYLALQGSLQGLVVHGMQGFDYDRARSELNVPVDHEVLAMAAIGKPGADQRSASRNSSSRNTEWAEDGERNHVRGSFSFSECHELALPRHQRFYLDPHWRTRMSMTPATNALLPTPEQMQAFLALPDEVPIVMVNLLKFKPAGGAAEYAKYAAGIDPILKKIGAKVLFSGEAQFCLIGQADWDAVALVQYPRKEVALRNGHVARVSGHPSVSRGRSGRADQLRRRAKRSCRHVF